MWRLPLVMGLSFCHPACRGLVLEDTGAALGVDVSGPLILWHSERLKAPGVGKLSFGLQTSAWKLVISFYTVCKFG